jgi:paraquat-inducible protein A
VSLPPLLACPECDLLHQATRSPGGTTQVCARCGAELGHGRPADVTRVLALFVTALILFVAAHAFPLLTVRLHGTVREASIPGCVRILTSLGWPWLTAILLTTVVLGPLVHLSGMVVVLVQVARGRLRSWTARAFRILEEFRRWGMLEVFLLGVMVSYVKLAKNAVVRPGLSLYALAGFIVAATAAFSALEPRVVWDAIGPAAAPGLPGELRGASARAADLQSCPACGLVADLGHRGPCPRCSASLHSRKPDSTGRTWALLWTSIFLYIPANVLPVTRVVSLGRSHEDTILSGVQYFLRTGSWPLAVVIFVASVTVPVVKFVVLVLLLLAVRFRWRRRPRLLAWLYRLSEAIGRWSMVDIFAITIMVAMFQAGSLSSVVPRPGAMAFALMVITTILAVRCFDPRLIWDQPEPGRG